MEDEVLNPSHHSLEKMLGLGFDPNSPGMDMEAYMDNEHKVLDSFVRKMAEDGLIPEDRWQEYKNTFPNEQ